MFKKIREKLKYFDWMLFIPYAILCVIGIVMVYSASSINLSYVGLNSASYMIKQAIYVVIGMILMFLLAHFKTKWWVNSKFLMIGFVIMAVALFIAKFFTNAINGANGWIQLGPISIQPSEFAKLFNILFCSYTFSNWADRRERGLGHGNGPYVALAIILGLIIWEPDIGGFMINFAIIMIMYLTYRDPETSKWNRINNQTFLIGLIILFVIMLQVPRLKFIQDLSSHFYQIQRFTAFYHPFKYSASVGRQLVNSYYAISNGGFFGLGLGNSIEKRGYLPEPYTDFILSVTTEELGFIGAAVLIILLLFIILRVYLIGIRSNNLYNRIFCFGVGTFMFVESFFNIGAVIGLLPITGVTFPFVSYGGSSMLVLSAALGMVMNISANQKRHNEIDPFEYYKK